MAHTKVIGRKWNFQNDDKISIWNVIVQLWRSVFVAHSDHYSMVFETHILKIKVQKIVSSDWNESNGYLKVIASTSFYIYWYSKESYA